MTDSQPGRNGRVGWITAIMLAALAVVVILVVLSARDDNGQQLTSVSTSIGASVTAATPSSVVPTQPAATEPAITPAASTLPVVTTAAPIATAPVTTATTIPAAEAPGPLSAAQAESFMRDYYAQVAAGDYTESWSQLTPEFQRGKARSFEYYTGFWDENDVEVGDIDLVESDARQAIVHVDLRWNGSNTWLTEEFKLRRVDDVWLIAGQKTIDG